MESMPNQSIDVEASNVECGNYHVIVDAIFGFSFKGEPREPFASILQNMKKMQNDSESNAQIISVDVPSGWNVDDGPSSSNDEAGGSVLVPDVLVSLTAPKLCAKGFRGRHFVGGRFLPPSVAEKYGIQVS